MVAIQCEIDVGYPERIDMRDMRGGRGRDGGNGGNGIEMYIGDEIGPTGGSVIGVSVGDGVESVFCTLEIGTKRSIERLDPKIGHDDVYGSRTTFFHDLFIGFGGEVADNEEGLITGGGEFFFELEPAEPQIMNGGVEETEVGGRLYKRIHGSKDKFIREVESDVM